MLQSQGVFGGVEMGYDEMYQGLYMVSAPVSFVQVVVECCGYSEPKECPQEEFWTMADELALELAICPANVHPDDFSPDRFEMCADSETRYVYLVNYKGEGEGYFNYNEVKDRIKGKYNGKYNYS